MIGGNISTGKSTLGENLKHSLPDSIYIEEKFKELKKLPLYYEECQRTKKTENKHNKYALDLQLEFLELRFENERFRNELFHKNLILDRCIFEDFHIFAKSQLELGFLIRVFRSRRFQKIPRSL